MSEFNFNFNGKIVVPNIFEYFRCLFRKIFYKKQGVDHVLILVDKVSKEFHSIPQPDLVKKKFDAAIDDLKLHIDLEGLK